MLKVTTELNEKLLEECRYLLHTVGYCVIERYLNPDYCDELAWALKSHIDRPTSFDVERAVQDKYHIHDLLSQDITFARLLEDPNLDSLLAPHLGEHWVMYAFTSSSLPPFGANYGSRIHVDSPRLIPGYPTNMGVIWALTEFTASNGGTQLLPGSHHSETKPSDDFFERHSITLECPRGSMIIFNARVYHRAGNNETSVFRHSLTMNACRSYMKQRMDWVRFIPREISGELSERARRIIGFDTRVPTNLEEFFVPDESRLYKPNQG
jgi:hypothetical protein